MTPLHARQDSFGEPYGSPGRLDISRRQAIGSIAGLATTLLPLNSAFAQAAPLLTPEMFGARGDGVADDYPALIRLAAAVGGTRNSLVRFGRGRRYRIGQVQTAGAPGSDSPPHVIFERCSGLRIDLNGSTVDVKGDFHRGRGAANNRRSPVNAIIPFVFMHCSELSLENGTLNGNADRMTRDATVVEGPGHGVVLAGCSGVVLRHLHIHHFSVDGVYIRPGRDGQICQGVSLDQVRLTNNGRQGLTNAGGRQVSAVDSHFSETGNTGGPYRHSPAAGVDIEPLRLPAVRSDFRALRCRFDDNFGGALIVGNPDTCDYVELVDCGGRRQTQGRLILSCERALIRGGTWHNIQIACAYGAHREFQHDIAIEVTGGRWTGDDPNWSPIYDLSPRRPRVHIHDNQFVLRSPAPFVPTYPFRCANEHHRFEGNEVFVAASGHGGSGDDFVAQFAGAVVVGNRWSTDLRSPRRFVNNYRGAQRVENERFAGSFAGSATTP